MHQVLVLRLSFYGASQKIIGHLLKSELYVDGLLLLHKKHLHNPGRGHTKSASFGLVWAFLRE